MNDPEFLLYRLNEIGISLANKPSALALIGLGSVGLELERLDRYSDLDFFVIVQAGSKAYYLDDLTWLTDIAPTAYYFANTIDGYKLLYEDGVFCEFAVFEEVELQQIPFAPGRIVWKATGVDETIRLPKKIDGKGQQQTIEWLIGEALSNLYVGLSREHRGEKLSATRFIQGFAVDHLLELAERIEPATIADQDPFNIERRYELRYPGMKHYLPEFLQGYEKNQESALAVLSFLDKYFDINVAMKEAVLGLCSN